MERSKQIYKLFETMDLGKRSLTALRSAFIVPRSSLSMKAKNTIGRKGQRRLVLLRLDVQQIDVRIADHRWSYRTIPSRSIEWKMLVEPGTVELELFLGDDDQADLHPNAPQSTMW